MYRKSTSIPDRGSLRNNPSCVEAKGGAETPVKLAQDNPEGRKSATHAAAMRTPTKWPPKGGVLARADSSSTFDGHFVEVLVADI